MIDSYKFGQIIIDGIAYTSDIIIYSDKIIPNWRRKSGHLLKVNDLMEVINEQPNLLIIGTGESGLMKVDPSVPDLLESKHISLIIEPTELACKTYNKLHSGKKVIGAFHITC